MSPTFDSIAMWLADYHLLAGALLAIALAVLAALQQPAQRMAAAKATIAALAALAALCALPGWSVVHLFSADVPAPPSVTASVTPLPMDVGFAPIPAPPSLSFATKTPPAPAAAAPTAPVQAPLAISWPFA